MSELFAGVLSPSATWFESHKGHPVFIGLADRHYTRQKHGSNQAARPGVNLTLLRVSIALMAGVSTWRWVSGSGAEAVFEMEGE